MSISNKKLSAYRIMWLQVIFDLPVQTPKQRKKATDFRKGLLSLGFEMEQFSVYIRHCADSNIAQGYIETIQSYLPKEGSVRILTFTDKQFENIVSFVGGKTSKKRTKQGKQLALF